MAEAAGGLSGGLPDDVMPVDPSIVRLWDRYRASDPAAPATVPTSFHFCDNQRDADICALLVAIGKKRATATSLAELELDGEPVPHVGAYAIVTDWTGEAKAVIRTTSVEIRRFYEVDEDFAREEGEGDCTLEWWRTVHDAYYKRVLTDSGHVVDANLEIACERFELLLVA